MNNIKTIKLNNGAEIPAIGIGPGIVGEVFKPTLPSNTFFAKIERKLIFRIKYRLADALHATFSTTLQLAPETDSYGHNTAGAR